MGDFDSPYGAVRELAEMTKERDALAFKLGEEIARCETWIKKCELAQKRADAAEALVKQRAEQPRKCFWCGLEQPSDEERRGK